MLLPSARNGRQWLVIPGKEIVRHSALASTDSGSSACGWSAKPGVAVSGTTHSSPLATPPFEASNVVLLSSDCVTALNMVLQARLRMTAAVVRCCLVRVLC